MGQDPKETFSLLLNGMEKHQASVVRTGQMLRLGSRGAAVADLQRHLQNGGFYKGAIDSIYGPKMVEAVKQLQRRLGLVVDGVVGPKTWAVLNEVRSFPDHVINIDGQDYVFETKNKKAELKIEVGSAPKAHTWIITRENGFPLFAIRPAANDKPFRILTAKQLYSEGVQWFEPLADNYRELIRVHPNSEKSGSESFQAYKHFTWKNIIEFSLVDRWSITYAKGFAGDWKASSKGGAGYLLVSIEGTPYWADAIGQIPFAVDTFKDQFDTETGDKARAITKTIKIGMRYGDGNPANPKEDKSNTYDNFMVLRGALWASDNHPVTKEENTILWSKTTTFRLDYKFMNDKRLKAPIDEAMLKKYGEWAKPQ